VPDRKLASQEPAGTFLEQLAAFAVQTDQEEEEGVAVVQTDQEEGEELEILLRVAEERMPLEVGVL
jgi:hypothetical protein